MNFLANPVCVCVCVCVWVQHPLDWGPTEHTLLSYIIFKILTKPL